MDVAPIAGRMSYVQSGKLKALAIGGPSRLKLLPDVPTVAESGYPGYEATGWGGNLRTERHTAADR
jgi:tripartite-type tricarboxylate transporter receptor subunit TctC